MEKLSFISNLWNNQNSNFINIANSNILKIGNTLNSILNDLSINKNSKLTTPSIVVVGTQSSGKSSVLNGILSMDILPTGKNMVTRTPLNLQLIQTESVLYAEFGNYDNYKWSTIKKINLSSPLPTDNELNEISKEIKKQTLDKAGDQMGISSKEIFIKIYSPNVPNLNLIDLPGLTMVACTDKGQPKDIKDQIRNMVKSYIEPERTLILAVLPAREDLEADAALDLVKEVDPDGVRTIGVLTKVDLMNKGTHIADYLENNVSKDLTLDYGYFAVKNRSHRETDSMNILEGLENERDFFKNHKLYKNIDNQFRLGTYNLGQSLSKILIENIRKFLPDILNDIIVKQRDIEKTISEMGNPIPSNDEGKIALLNSIINDICTKFIDSLEKRGTDINTGRNVKEVLVTFRTNLENINPFDSNLCNDKYITNIMKNCEGNHMSFPLPPIEVLESCLMDSNKQPFREIIPPSLGCVKDISKLLTNLSTDLLNKDSIKRFRKLSNQIGDTINEIIIYNQELTITKIEEIIETEKNYIWTDDQQFLTNLQNMFSKFQHPLDINIMREILVQYFNSIKIVLQHTIPKTIMLFLVRKVENSLRTKLYENIQKKDFIDLLSESTEQNEKRNKLNSVLTRLQSAKKILDEL